MTAGVATTYFTALALQDRLLIAQQNLKESTDTLAVIRARLEVGTATALDVAQQEALVAGQRAAIPSLRSQLEQQVIGARHPGRAAAGGDRDRRRHARRPHRAEPGARACRATLLARRPDVAGAEAQLAAQNANIRAARAAFFPSFSLSAAGGWQSLALSSLFGPGATAASLAGSVTQTIFDNGNLSGQLEQARGRYDELLADYRKAIVQAFTDVENALTALRYATEQEALERTRWPPRGAPLDIARAQLGAGTVDVTTVLTAEQTLYRRRGHAGAGPAGAVPGAGEPVPGAWAAAGRRRHRDGAPRNEFPRPRRAPAGRPRRAARPRRLRRAVIFIVVVLLIAGGARRDLCAQPPGHRAAPPRLAGPGSRCR